MNVCFYVSSMSFMRYYLLQNSSNHLLEWSSCYRLFCGTLVDHRVHFQRFLGSVLLYCCLCIGRSCLPNASFDCWHYFCVLCGSHLYHPRIHIFPWLERQHHSHCALYHDNYWNQQLIFGWFTFKLFWYCMNWLQWFCFGVNPAHKEWYHIFNCRWTTRGKFAFTCFCRSELQ